MGKKVLLGYSGNFISGFSSALKIKELKEKLRKNPNNKKVKAEIKLLNEKRVGSPVYISAKKYEKLKEFREMQHLSSWMD